MHNTSKLVSLTRIQVSVERLIIGLIPALPLNQRGSSITIIAGEVDLGYT